MQKHTGACNKAMVNEVIGQATVAWNKAEELTSLTGKATHAWLPDLHDIEKRKLLRHHLGIEFFNPEFSIQD